MFSNAQSDALKGCWILDSITYTNGEPLEINHALYTIFMEYRIEKNKLVINNSTFFKATFTSNQILTPYKKSNYKLEGNYLQLTEWGDDKTYYYLKEEDYLAKYPEFIPRQVTYRGKTLLQENAVVNPFFDEDISLHEFLISHMKEYKNIVPSNSYFKAKFILTADNQITDVTIVDSINKEFDGKFLKALKKAKGKLINTIGKDMLVAHEFRFLARGKFVTSEERKVAELMLRADEHYSKNYFQEALVLYEKAFETEENRAIIEKHKHFFSSSIIYMGVCYLVLGDTDNACKAFGKIGDSTNFHVRNYLRNFCQ
ncbi:hypothetical protein Y10_09180 [Neptunitalea sp. Y10]|uniref:Tetratricopeptide repeat protein n=1 Tax=Neptunitalea lumnitzerae TaxID=2965509 RepID=A0ABQ5MGN4_9FLAO|nr:hypothetical protein Y10_09180 [Neptunitalea sp. Y10]